MEDYCYCVCCFGLYCFLEDGDFEYLWFYYFEDVVDFCFFFDVVFVEGLVCFFWWDEVC